MCNMPGKSRRAYSKHKELRKLHWIKLQRILEAPRYSLIASSETHRGSSGSRAHRRTTECSNMSKETSYKVWGAPQDLYNGSLLSRSTGHIQSNAGTNVTVQSIMTSEPQQKQQDNTEFWSGNATRPKNKWWKYFLPTAAKRHTSLKLSWKTN